MFWNLLASLVRARDASQEAAAQRIALPPSVSGLQEQARAAGFEPLGLLGERVRFTGRSIFVEVWANPEHSTYLSIVLPRAAGSQLGYFFSTRFRDGAYLLRYDKREIVTRGRGALELSAGAGSFDADLAAHTKRVEALVRGGKQALPAVSVEDRVAGVERFYRAHLALGNLVALVFPALQFLAMLTVLPCLLAISGSAGLAYSALGVVLVLPLMTCFD